MHKSCYFGIGHPSRVEVQSSGFEDAQSFSDRHTMQFIRDQPLPVINAVLVDMGGNEVKRSKSRQYNFTAEIQESGRIYSKVTFDTSTNNPPLELPLNLTAQAFTIIVKAEIEEQVCRNNTQDLEEVIRVLFEKIACPLYTVLLCF